MLAAQQGSLRARSAYLGRRSIFLLRATQHDLQRIIRQWPLQRLRLIPWRAHPHIALLLRGQDHRHGLGMYRLDYGVGRCSEKAVDLMRPRIGFDLVPRSPLKVVQMPANANGGRFSLDANQTTSFFLVSRFGSGAYSAKLLAGTKHRLSGLSHIRQWDEDVLRILVTGGPPVRGGGGMPQRIMASSLPVSVLRITGAG
jgi:hypothetical protein